MKSTKLAPPNQKSQSMHATIAQLSVTPDTTHMPISGTIHSSQVEEPQETFMVRVLRPPCWNVFHQPARWEMWKVLAETEAGAVRIARYHFYNAETIQLLGEA